MNVLSILCALIACNTAYHIPAASSVSNTTKKCSFLVQIDTGRRARTNHFDYLESHELNDGVQNEWQIGQTFQGYHMNICKTQRYLALADNGDTATADLVQTLQQAPNVIAIERDQEVSQLGWEEGELETKKKMEEFKENENKLDNEVDDVLRDNYQYNATMEEEESIASCYDIKGQQKNTVACQKDATWSLHRVGNRDVKLPLNPSNLAYPFSYVFEPEVRPLVYIMDTQVWVKHPQFAGRAKTVKSYVDLIEDGDSTTVWPSHGTHVAGIVGAARYGNQKWSQLLSVVTLGKTGTGSFSNVLNGATWIAADAAARKSPLPAVVNLSLSGGKSVVVNAAMDAMVSAGLVVVVAVGNSKIDACTQSPASAIKPVKVGASDSKDQFATFSNWGACLDVIAPGVVIQSTGPYDKMIAMSGTSMSSPSVAGIIASALANGDLSIAQARDNYQLKYFLNQKGIPNKITNVPQGTANLLVQNANTQAPQCGTDDANHEQKGELLFQNQNE